MDSPFRQGEAEDNGLGRVITEDGGVESLVALDLRGQSALVRGVLAGIDLERPG
jgi:hypothetical protein